MTKEYFFLHAKRIYMRTSLLIVALPCISGLLITPGLCSHRCVAAASAVRANVPICAASKKKKKSNMKGGSSSTTARGFGAPPAAPPPPPKAKTVTIPSAKAAATASTSPAAVAAAELIAVDLGKGKKVAVKVPPKADEPTEADLSLDGLLSQYSHLYGAGDVVWPASMALARMLAHVPTLTAGKRVLELGCGLGLAGLAAASHAGAKSVVLTDRDDSVLQLAREAIAANELSEGADAIASTATLDWGADAAELAASIGVEPFDVIIGADILYDAGACELLAGLLARLLPASDDVPAARVLLADPAQRLNRGVFATACANVGLAVADDVLPGPEDVRLVGVVRE